MLAKSAVKKYFKGFTLIELPIVIAILGILAAAVLVAIDPGKRTRQAQEAAWRALSCPFGATVCPMRVPEDFSSSSRIVLSACGWRLNFHGITLQRVPAC